MLEKPVNMSGWEEIFAPGDMGDLLGCIVEDDREMIGGSDVFAGKDDIPQEGWVNFDGAMDQVGEGEWTRKC